MDDDNDDPVKVPGFSKGYWNFRLFAYADADRQNLAYWGEVDSVLIDSGHHKASATVSPVSGGTGYLKVGTITFVPAASISAPTDLVVYTDSVWELEGEEWVLVDDQPVDGIYTLSAKQYKFTREYSFDSIPVASGSVIVTIYSNLTTTVSGSLSELTTYADFEGKQNPDIVKETWGSELIDKDTTGDVDFTKNLDPKSTSKVTAATMPATAAVAKLAELEEAVGADDDSSSKLKLNLNVDTTEVKPQSVTYDIGMEAILTYTKNQTQSVAKSDVKNIDDYVIVVIDLDSDISGVSVTHSGVAMIKFADSEAGYAAFLAADTDNDELVPATATSEAFYKGFYCLRTVGETKTLNIKTRSFSPFEVTYEMKDYVAAIGSVKYVTLDAAIAAASTEKTDTIIILKDITSNNGFLVNKSLNIDTNGHTITVTNGSNINNRAFKVDNGKKLTVFGGGIIDAAGTATTGCYGAFRAEVGTELYLEGITLKNYRNNGLNVKVLGAKAELKNVSIISENGGGIEVTDDKGADGTVLGYAKLTGCTMTQSNYYDWCSVPVSVSGNSKVDVYSTSYTGEHGVYVFSSGGIINIYGGIYTAKSHGVLVTTYSQTYGNEAVINVYDGSFNGTFSIGTSGHEHLTITGGVFDHDPSAYVAEGYKANEFGDYWVVLPAVVTDDVAIISDAGVKTMSFAAFRDSVNAGNTYEGQTVELLRDIDLEGVNWTPIGTNDNPFSGVFDGCGYTISNINVDKTTLDAGLFGVVRGIHSLEMEQDYTRFWDVSTSSFKEGSDTESNFKTIIKNVTLSSVDIRTTEDYTGALAGYTIDTYIGNVHVTSGSVYAAGGKVGGVIGSSNGFTVLNNLTTGESLTVKGDKHTIGGIVGNIQRGYSNGDHIKVYPSAGEAPKHAILVENCTNNAAVIWDKNGKYDGGVPIAGIIGNAGSISEDLTVVVYRCTNNGTIQAGKCSFASGIIGQSHVKVKVVYGCVNTGSITADAYYPLSEADQGGVAGITITGDASLIACSNTGTLTNTHEGGGNVYQITSAWRNIIIEASEFATVSDLATEINSRNNDSCVAVVLRNVSVTDKTETLSLPQGIQSISANTKVCDSVDLSGSLTHVNMVGLNQSVAVSKTVVFGGSGNNIYVEQGSTTGNIHLQGTNNSVTNNGTMGVLTYGVYGTSGEFTAVNNGTMKGFGTVTGSSIMTFTNNVDGVVSREDWHTFDIETGGELTIHNYGTIHGAQGNPYALLLYGSCDVNFHAYAGSTVTGGFAAYSQAHTVNIYAADGTTINGSPWESVASSTWHVIVQQ